jgi:branched-subunit amino acid ABC-type transport system permease component
MLLLLQLVIDGIVHGCAIGLVAVTFAYIYVTTGIFHVAHAGVLTLGGYLAWYFAGLGVPFPVAVVMAIVGCAVVGMLIQKGVYQPLMTRRSTHLVMLIASIGIVAVIQNLLAIVFTPNVLQFDMLSWRTTSVHLGPVDLTYPQILTVVVSISAAVGLMLFSSSTALGRRARAVASNRGFAEIARLRPNNVYLYVAAMASGLVGIAGISLGVDQALQPYSSLALLLTAVIAVIAGGVGSLRGAFIVAVTLGVLQNLVLALVPGRWSQALIFAIFITFILIRPTGLFQIRMQRAS